MTARNLLGVSVMVAMVVLPGASRPVLAQDRPAVFVHGLASSGDTWTTAAARLASTLAISPETPTIPWYERFSVQADSLEEQVGWQLATPAVAVGHSNGGVVIREWSRQRPLAGGLTIGTPHWGAPLAYQMPAWILYNWDLIRRIGEIGTFFSANWKEWSWVYFTMASALDFIGQLSNTSVSGLIYIAGLHLGLPVIPEMSPGSSYLSGLNSSGNVTRESSAIPARVGIVVRTENFFYAGAIRAFSPENADNVAVAMYSTVSVLLGAASLISAHADYADFGAHDTAARLAGLAFQIADYDLTYCAAVSSTLPLEFRLCERSDTVVPEWSQDWPNAIRMTRIGPPHIRETGQMAGELEEALVTLLHVDPRGAEAPPPGPAPDPDPVSDPAPDPEPGPDPNPEPDPGPDPSLPAGATEFGLVSLRVDNGQYVVAEGGGGGVVNADRDLAGPWEQFRLYDLDGGDLRDGDAVVLQSDQGWFLQAADGGGGPVLAIGEGPWAWEQFVVVNIDSAGGSVGAGSRIALQSDSGLFVVAEEGGGAVVNANRSAIGPWEIFRLVVH